MRQLQRNRRAEAYATVNASGAATAIVAVPLGPSWEVRQISVTCGGTLIPQATTYVGTNNAGVYISQTLIGNSDTDSAPNVTVRSGESLCAVWSGATVGAQAKITVIYDEVGY